MLVKGAPGRQRPVYPPYAMQWLLVTWRRNKPGHHQITQYGVGCIDDYRMFLAKNIWSEIRLYIDRLYRSSTWFATINIEHKRYIFVVRHCELNLHKQGCPHFSIDCDVGGGNCCFMAFSCFNNHKRPSPAYPYRITRYEYCEEMHTFESNYVFDKHISPRLWHMPYQNSFLDKDLNYLHSLGIFWCFRK